MFNIKISKKTNADCVWLMGLLRILCVCACAAFVLSGNLPAQEMEKISKFGEYKGYSEEIYDSSVRTSQYLTMRDGIKIAIDIVRPAQADKVHEDPLPVVWTHTRYRRSFVRDGKLRSELDSPFYQTLLKHGYVLAAADVRGSGASFGSWQGIWSQEETQDAYEITEWLASQPWCDGKIGMAGGSYLGITQLMAAGTKPPHLKAIFPVVALLDIYAVAYPGGVFYHDFIQHWSELTAKMDTQVIAAPVDEDKDEALLKSAIADHKLSRPLIEIFMPLKYRDSVDQVTGVQPFYTWHPAAFLEGINESVVPIYLWCGWMDSFTREGFSMFRNFKNPKKIVMGAWSHSPRDPDIQKEAFMPAIVEEIRWFDYWLKGIDNGIMDEPPIRYHVMNAPKDNEWRTADEWPLPEQNPTKYYFHAGPSGSVASVNDGRLSTEQLSSNSGKDDYAVDYTTTSGTATRWDNAVGGSFDYPDMTANDEKGLTYTTETLEKDLEITGHSVVHLWASSTATDGDFFALLEEVDAEGVSHYVSEGALRASHRALHEPYYDNLGLPFHRSHEEDMVELKPGEPAELAFDLQPISNVFNAGNRIRITITCADKDNASTPELSPPPTVSVYRNTQHASYITLPVIQAADESLAADETSLGLILGIALGVIIFVIVFTTFMRRRLRTKP
ncbi:MAG: CocE/NonD family hydrolase [Candidatus Aminicenantes bacterium]|nr:MAG: CocE/NonD family hydrolase [Candidatus Aminicenantes bacterium]